MTLQRKTPMPPPVKPMSRTPFPSTGSLTRHQGLAPKPAVIEGGGAPVVSLRPERQRRDTGFPRSVKLDVRKRAGNGEADDAACEACGKWLGRRHGQVQHRLARGSGGSSDPLVSSIVNAALLCGTPYEGCHGKAESREESREMEAWGFVIRHGKGPEHDPRYVPVLLHSTHGSGVTVWLLADGTYGFEAPEGAS